MCGDKQLEVLRLEIGKLELLPGDVLAVKVRGRDLPTRAELQYIQDAVKAILPGVQFLIFDDCIELSVIKPPK